MPARPPLPALHPALEPYRATLERIGKPACLIRFTAAALPPRAHTHLGGTTPFLPMPQSWPVCTGCSHPLSFVWQVNFADFAETPAFEQKGLLQFFYCFDCMPMPFGWNEPDPGQWECRWLPDFDAERQGSLPQAECPYADYRDEDRFPAWQGMVARLVPFLSVPSEFNTEPHIPASVMEAAMGDMHRWEPDDAGEGTFPSAPFLSRIGGYVPWVQSDDATTPRCPHCGNPAEFVGAIGSGETELLWGDSGYWYFFACRKTATCNGLAEPLLWHECL